MEEQQIKSRQRVAERGEVFTTSQGLTFREHVIMVGVGTKRLFIYGKEK